MLLDEQVHLIEGIMQSLLAGADSQVDRGTEAVVLISSLLDSAKLFQAEQLHIMGRCICTVLCAVYESPAPTPTTLSNLLDCLQLQEYAGKLLAAPESESGLARETVETVQAGEGADRHVAELLGLALALFSRAGGHIAGSAVIGVLLSPQDPLEGRHTFTLVFAFNRPC